MHPATGRGIGRLASPWARRSLRSTFCVPSCDLRWMASRTRRSRTKRTRRTDASAMWRAVRDQRPASCTTSFPPPPDRRVIRPYWNVIEPFVKQRWVGRTLLDVFSKEFPGGSPAYYADAIACGRIMVNRRRRDADYVLKGGDRLFHRVRAPHTAQSGGGRSRLTPEQLWRVEPPIPADSVDIVAEDDQWLVVDKPAGVPIHAGGGYLHNTLVRGRRRPSASPTANAPLTAAAAVHYGARAQAGRPQGHAPPGPRDQRFVGVRSCWPWSVTDARAQGSCSSPRRARGPVRSASPSRSGACESTTWP